MLPQARHFFKDYFFVKKYMLLVTYLEIYNIYIACYTFRNIKNICCLLHI